MITLPTPPDIFDKIYTLLEKNLLISNMQPFQRVFFLSHAVSHK
jgi:hypothetical protein